MSIPTRTLAALDRISRLPAFFIFDDMDTEPVFYVNNDAGVPIAIGVNLAALFNNADGKVKPDALSGATLFNLVKVAGQDETGDATIPVTGAVAGDQLVQVFVEDGTSGKWTQRAIADFTGPAAGNITVVANAANNVANAYIIAWLDLTA